MSIVSVVTCQLDDLDVVDNLGLDVLLEEYFYLMGTHILGVW